MTELSLVVIYDMIVGDDSDVSGGYDMTPKYLNNELNNFWRSYDTRRAFFETAEIAEFVEQGPLWRTLLQLEQKCIEHDNDMTLYRGKEQRCFETYRSQILAGDSEDTVAREYKRLFARLIKLIVDGNRGLSNARNHIYQESVISAMRARDPEDGKINLQKLCRRITRNDSDVGGKYDLSRETLEASMKDFWRTYDDEDESARRSRAYSSTMEGYRRRAHQIVEGYASGTVEIENNLANWTAWGKETKPTSILAEYERDITDMCTRDTDANLRSYKSQFAALLKIMVPYLQERKQKMFARMNLLPDIHEVVDSFCDPLINPFILRH